MGVPRRCGAGEREDQQRGERGEQQRASVKWTKGTLHLRDLHYLACAPSPRITVGRAMKLLLSVGVGEAGGPESTGSDSP